MFILREARDLREKRELSSRQSRHSRVPRGLFHEDFFALDLLL